MDLHEQLEVGKQAEDFNRYIEEHPYFKGLLGRIGRKFDAEILTLGPDQKEAFSRLMTGKIAMSTVLEEVGNDIYLGSEALKKLEGRTEEPKGLL